MAKRALHVKTFSPTVLTKSADSHTPARGGISVPDVASGLVAASAAHTGTIAFGKGTDVGRQRNHNEDAVFAAPPLFIVADGMGGHAAGEIASELAVQTISQVAPAYPSGPMLDNAVQEANRAGYAASCANERRSGMGTTGTAALLLRTRLAIAQVGDSRAYLLHHGTLQQLTRDHSLMQDLIDAGEITPAEARIHPQRNFITRALGTGPSVKADIYELNVSPGDRLLLCSDGLSGMLEDDDIERVLNTVRNPQTCVNNLIRAANRAGGYDNVSAIVVDVPGSDAAADALERRRSIINAAVIGGIAVVLIVAAVVLMKFLGGA